MGDRMQFIKCPQTTTKMTTIFSGRACCRLLDYHFARHGRHSSFLDRFPNTQSHTQTEGERERGQIGPPLDAVAAGQLYCSGGEGGRKGAGGRAGAGGR